MGNRVLGTMIFCRLEVGVLVKLCYCAGTKALCSRVADPAGIRRWRLWCSRWVDGWVRRGGGGGVFKGVQKRDLGGDT